VPVKPWTDCTALVTGGRRGLGRAYADELARLGARVLVTSRTPAGPGELRWDLDDPASTKELLAAVPEIDLLVHAAHAFGPHQPLFSLRAEELAASLQRNVVAAYDLLRGVCRRMSRAGFGRVLVIGSLAVTAGFAGQVAYIVEKSALSGLARAFAAELAGKGVLVNVVHPAIVDTENVRERLRPELLEAYRLRAPGGKLLSPADVVLASLALLDPRQEGVTGQSLAVTGGVDFP
jgi:NAD(P)-dependent dehydrogenase (short-subunit alcohol dehydrogenase family)